MASLKDTLGDQPYDPSYPNAPGYQARPTSIAAARFIGSTAANIQAKVLAAIQAAGLNGLTADEASAKVGHSVLTIRPRVAELAKMNPPRIVDSGQRRKNESGRSAIVWVMR